MKRLTVMMVCALAVFASKPTQAAEVNFVMDLKPLTFYAMPDIDGFYAYDSGAGWYIEERVSGKGVFNPNFNMGLGIETKVAHFDLTGGLGVLVSDAITGYTYNADLAARFKLGPVTIGPHFGIFAADPEWDGEADISINHGDAEGFKYGFDFSVGGKKAGFSLKLDVIDVDEIAVEQLGTWQASAPSIDFSGWSIDMGAIFHF